MSRTQLDASQIRFGVATKTVSMYVHKDIAALLGDHALDMRPLVRSGDRVDIVRVELLPRNTRGSHAGWVARASEGRPDEMLHSDKFMEKWDRVYKFGPTVATEAWLVDNEDGRRWVDLQLPVDRPSTQVQGEREAPREARGTSNGGGRGQGTGQARKTLSEAPRASRAEGLPEVAATVTKEPRVAPPSLGQALEDIRAMVQMAEELRQSSAVPFRWDISPEGRLRALRIREEEI